MTYSFFYFSKKTLFKNKMTAYQDLVFLQPRRGLIDGCTCTREECICDRCEACTIGDREYCNCWRVTPSPYEELWSLGLWCSGCQDEDYHRCTCYTVQDMTHCKLCDARLSIAEFGHVNGYCFDCRQD
jgi:hypothetical protein